MLFLQKKYLLANLCNQIIIDTWTCPVVGSSVTSDVSFKPKQCKLNVAKPYIITVQLEQWKLKFKLLEHC